MSQSLFSARRTVDEIVTLESGRREFLGTLARFTIAGLVIGVVGCTTEPEAESASKPVAGGCPQSGLAKTAVDRSGTIASNHGHVATVTTAQQDAGTAFNLSIQGSSGHDHTLSLTTQDLADLKAGSQVAKTSSSGAGHTHVVTFAAVVTGLAPRC